MIDITSATTKELVDFYNAQTGKNIKKFRDRATAEQQCAALLKLLGGHVQLPKSKHPKGKLSKPWPFPKEGKEDDQVPDHGKEGKEDDHGLRAAATAQSWADESIRAARTARHHVVADGVEYRSVKAAFEALRLPMSKHVKFRAALKNAASGELVIDDHKFTLIRTEK